MKGKVYFRKRSEFAALRPDSGQGKVCPLFYWFPGNCKGQQITPWLNWHWATFLKKKFASQNFFFENQASRETLLDSAGNAEEGNKLCPITTDCDAPHSFASWHRICFAQNQFEWKFYTLDDLKYYWAIESELTKRLSITSRQIRKNWEIIFFYRFIWIVDWTLRECGIYITLLTFLY